MTAGENDRLKITFLTPDREQRQAIKAYFQEVTERGEDPELLERCEKFLCDLVESVVFDGAALPPEEAYASGLLQFESLDLLQEVAFRRWFTDAGNGSAGPGGPGPRPAGDAGELAD
jgi:hypothetical protein